MQQSNAARQENQQAIQDANKQLLAANTEVGKAQVLVKSLEEERDLLATAKPLSPPPANVTRGWTDTVSLDLGISLKLPAGNEVQTNDNQSLTVAKTGNTDGLDARWLSLSPYNERLEKELLVSLTTSTPVSYIIQGHVVTGYQGTMPGRPDPVLILRIRKDGVISHLLWIRNPNGAKTDAKPAIDVLSTMRFES